MPIDRALGRRIRYRRRLIDMTQEELATRLHTTQPAIAAWEKGLVQPRPDTLARIAAALETPIEYFIDGE